MNNIATYQEIKAYTDTLLPDLSYTTIGKTRIYRVDKFYIRVSLDEIFICELPEKKPYSSSKREGYFEYIVRYDNACRLSVILDGDYCRCKYYYKDSDMDDYLERKVRYIRAMLLSKSV